jgi:hypothetical protein
VAGKGRGVKAAAIFALLGAMVFAMPATAFAQEQGEAAGDSFVEALDGQTFLLSRTVAHAMADGAEISVTRTYRVRPTPAPDGWLVEGDSIAVEVDAPPQLAALAEMERRRDDSGTFPMRLDRDGMLAPLPAARPTDSETARQAGDLIAARIGESDASDDQKLAATAMARALVAAGQGKRIAWPVDLFRPIAAERIETLEIEGGTVTIALTAQADLQSGLMQRFERRVTTQISGSERVVREHWELRRDQAGSSTGE